MSNGGFVLLIYCSNAAQFPYGHTNRKTTRNAPADGGHVTGSPPRIEAFVKGPPATPTSDWHYHNRTNRRAALVPTILAVRHHFDGAVLCQIWQHIFSMYNSNAPQAIPGPPRPQRNQAQLQPSSRQSECYYCEYC